MHKKILAIALFLSFFYITACDNDDTTIKEPQNLVVDAEISSDGSGMVTFVASAEHANFYTFNYGDGLNTTPTKVINGAVIYIYKTSGLFTVTVNAHATDDVFITTTITIDVAIFFTIPTTGYTTSLSYEGMSLTWADEFDGDTVNEDYWSFEIGDGCPNICGWGNNELQYYRKQNAIVDDGYLIIEAKSESFGGKGYTSTRMITRDNVEVKYGRVDVRAALPKGQGIWPAIWMLGKSINTVGWPACGEIDIMEMIGGNGREKTVHGTVHWEHNGNYASYDLASGTFSDAFHVFSIVWDEQKVVWYVDDIKYHEIDITPAPLSEFREEFFFILNVAVGGNWPGSPNASTQFPQRMVVDYIRVFQPN